MAALRDVSDDEVTFTTKEEVIVVEMDGKAVFKLSANVLPGFVARMFEGSPYSLDQVKLVVPHQASPTALWLMQRRLGIPEDKWMVIAHDHGNTIAGATTVSSVDLGNANSHVTDSIYYWIHATVPTRDRFAPIGDQARNSMPEKSNGANSRCSSTRCSGSSCRSRTI